MTSEAAAAMTDRELSNAFAIALNLAIDDGPSHIGTQVIRVTDGRARWERAALLLAEIKRRPDYVPFR